jgi:hypothetical protein
MACGIYKITSPDNKVYTRYDLSTNLSQVIKSRKKHCKQWTVQGVLS